MAKSPQFTVGLFVSGEAAGRVTTNCYPASMQKFSGDGSNEKLDLWVLERVLNFFSKTLEPKGIHNKGNIFFLHLLGIDTTGHATKPHSR
jgi:phosphatidylinositol glycan class N